MNLLSVTLGELVDRTLLRVQAAPEQGSLVTLGTTITASDTTFTLSAEVRALNVTDTVEFGSELMFVSEKTDDATPVYTVGRGHFQTTAAAHSSGALGYVNPQFPRRKVAEAIRSCFARLEALGLPITQSSTMFPVESVSDETSLVIEVPESAREVLSVRNGLFEVNRWHFIDDLPTDQYSSGKVIRLPRTTTEDSEFSVVYRTPYRWSNFPLVPVEDSTIYLPEGAEDLPPAYAAAWLASSREMSRAEIDRAEEWSRSEPMRGGNSAAHVRGLWQEFYRALDEARRLDPPLPRRPYVRRPR